LAGDVDRIAADRVIGENSGAAPPPARECH
jgi:hypothetical protein